MGKSAPKSLLVFCWCVRLRDQMESLFAASSGCQRKLDHGIEVHLDVSCFLARAASEVAIDQAQDSLVRNDQDRLVGPSETDHCRMQAVDHVVVRLATRIPVRKLVLLPLLVLLREHLFDLLISKTVEISSIDLIEGRQLHGPHLRPVLAPLLVPNLLVRDMPCCQDCALQCRSPQSCFYALAASILRDVLTNEFGEFDCVRFPFLRNWNRRQSSSGHCTLIAHGERGR